MLRRLSQKSPLCTPTFEEISAIHDYMIDQYGGKSGFRDQSILHSIIDKVENLEEEYNEGFLNIYDLAVTYLWYISHEHPFSDANKRTSVAVALSFLHDNGVDTVFDPAALEQLTKVCATSEWTDDIFHGESRYSFSIGDAREFFSRTRMSV